MKQWFVAQYQNAFLWVPFLFAFGAAVYFVESDLVCQTACAIAAAVTVMGFIFRNKYVRRAGLFFLAGFAYTVIYAHIINTPRIMHPVRNTTITARVTDIDYMPERARLYLSVPAAQINVGNADNVRVRVNLKDKININIGDEIQAKAQLFPFASAYAAGTFDGSRNAYFNGLGANGTISDVKIVSHQTGGTANTVRDYLHRHAKSFLADTLVMGYKGALPAQHRAIWTANGISHVWSISGFHMTLVGGWLFAIFFTIFRFIPYITRRTPARIPATVCAWVGLVMYLVISGMNVATVRAFLMTSLVFAALIIGRSALSMRNIAIAFCAIFFINPHYVMQVGFQLSFSAVFGLIWFWNNHRIPLRRGFKKLLYWLYAAAATSIIASIFTAPFVITHFDCVPIYSLIGNLVLVPIFSVAIMPAVIVGTIVAPMGIYFPLHWADALYERALHIAEIIANLPYANLPISGMNNTALILIIIGACCIMFIRRVDTFKHYITRNINYVIGGAVIICGMLAMSDNNARPVFYATLDHELVAFSVNGKLEFNKERSSTHYFAFDTWKQINGEATGTPNIRRKPDQGVWIYKSEKFTIVYIQRFVPLAREIVKMCRDDNIKYIISYYDIDAPKCNHKILRGGFVIYPNGTVQKTFTPRPWHNLRQ